ncbi:uncharacterized protein PAC_07065 [Phialocephala subalpina]|uniref:Uncharacterized protein n=1 Tax=Phialocephala subalpina TaxID=576137 RepID=A0A1L7WWN3_9HELO|nr:uncharacterized protein PAC_07065 [Phialocephala subalpina]
MYTPSLFTMLLFTLWNSGSAKACMHYKGVFPHNPTLPYEASISDNSVTTCWILTTYAEHKALQIAVSAQKQKTEMKFKNKRSNGQYMRLTSKAGLGFGKDGKDPDVKGLEIIGEEEQKSRARQFGQRKWVEVPKDEKEAGFLPWEFECLGLPSPPRMNLKGKMLILLGVIEGYKAHANVGARTVTYIAHGQEFYFIPKEQEDVENEKWVYDLKLWCGKPGKNGLILP